MGCGVSNQRFTRNSYIKLQRIPGDHWKKWKGTASTNTSSPRNSIMPLQGVRVKQGIIYAAEYARYYAEGSDTVIEYTAPRKQFLIVTTQSNHCCMYSGMYIVVYTIQLHALPESKDVHLLRLPPYKRQFRFSS